MIIECIYLFNDLQKHNWNQVALLIINNYCCRDLVHFASLFCLYAAVRQTLPVNLSMLLIVKVKRKDSFTQKVPSPTRLNSNYRPRCRHRSKASSATCDISLWRPSTSLWGLIRLSNRLSPFSASWTWTKNRQSWRYTYESMWRQYGILVSIQCK